MFFHSFHGVVYIMDSSTPYELVPFPTFSVNKGSNVCCSLQTRERERESLNYGTGYHTGHSLFVFA